MRDCVRQLQRNAVLFVNLKQWVIGIFTSGNTENFHETTLVGHEKGMKRAQKGHEKILEFIKDNPQISIPALAKEFGITVKAMRLTLDKLKAEKRISRIGPNKGGYWQVMDIAVTE